MITGNGREWELLRAGPPDPRHVLLPEGMCTGVFYADVLAEQRLAGRKGCFVAATPPGFGGRSPLRMSASRAMRSSRLS